MPPPATRRSRERGEAVQNKKEEGGAEGGMIS